MRARAAPVPLQRDLEVVGALPAELRHVISRRYISIADDSVTAEARESEHLAARGIALESKRRERRFLRRARATARQERQPDADGATCRIKRAADTSLPPNRALLQMNEQQRDRGRRHAGDAARLADALGPNARELLADLVREAADLGVIELRRQTRARLPLGPLDLLASAARRTPNSAPRSLGLARPARRSRARVSATRGDSARRVRAR